MVGGRGRREKKDDEGKKERKKESLKKFAECQPISK